MQTSYDTIGAYDQDAVNGFRPDFINQFIEKCEIKANDKVLDAMGGDGNLALKIYDAHPDIELTSADISKVQTDIARQRLSNNVRVLTCDLVNEKLFDGEFDKIVIKSGTHEIPKADQLKLYTNLFRALKPGGKLINLGILLDTEEIRAEINQLNYYRSTLAGVTQDITNRHFLTRKEFYNWLKEAGFADVESKDSFHYSIDMGILTEQYLKNDPESLIKMNGVATSLHQMRNNNLAILKKDWVIHMPGEITIATKSIAQ